MTTSQLSGLQSSVIAFSDTKSQEPRLVALLPELHQINNDSYPFKEQHQRIKNLLTSQGVPVIDLIDGLKDHGPENTLWVTPADDHPNGKANALIAQQLREWFRTQPRFWLPAQQTRRTQTFIVP